eukprot:UN25346
MPDTQGVEGMLFRMEGVATMGVACHPTYHHTGAFTSEKNTKFVIDVAKKRQFWHGLQGKPFILKAHDVRFVDVYQKSFPRCEVSQYDQNRAKSC